jgi:hypothetical protein
MSTNEYVIPTFLFNFFFRRLSTRDLMYLNENIINYFYTCFIITIKEEAMSGKSHQALVAVGSLGIWGYFEYFYAFDLCQVSRSFQKILDLQSTPYPNN